MGFLSRSFILASPLVTLSLAIPFNGQVIGLRNSLLSSYDYVVVGGGPSGLVVANRLSEDSNVTVLVIEAGELDNGEDSIVVPGFAGGLGASTVGTKYDWNLTYAVEEALNNRAVSMPVGKVVGGGTVLNRMLLDRGSKVDYDRWAELGNAGWDFEGLLPYFIKSETSTPPSPELVAEWGIGYDPSAHGTSGYLQSSYPPFVWPATKYFFEAMKSLNINIPVDATNGEALGAFWIPLAENPGVSTRCSGRNAYYDTVETRSNLHLLTGNQVTKLLTESTSGGVTVTGIEYAESSASAIQSVKANKEVILAAGTFHTPQLLQLSGIGQSSLLSSLGIQEVIDLPGVGENHQDHQYFPVVNVLSVPFQQKNLTNDPTLSAEYLAIFKENGTGPFSTTGSTSLSFLPLVNYTSQAATIAATAASEDSSKYLANDTDATVRAGYEAQYSIMTRDLSATDSAIVEIIYNDGTTLPALQHPFSRGSVKITTDDPFAAPQLNSRWLSNPLDLTVLVEAVKFARKIVATDAFASVSPFEALPGANITSDADIESFIRNNLATLYHPAGTTAMMPLDKGGVVSPELLVYGTTNLRVVDASVFPLLPATHIQSTVYAVAEKAADIIKAAAV